MSQSIMSSKTLSVHLLLHLFPYSCLLAGGRVELVLGLKQNNARFVMN